MSIVFWFFLGSLMTVVMYLAAAWFEEWRMSRERIKQAEDQVIKLWFGDDCE